MTPDIEKIEHLLNSKTFESLTASERQLVLSHVSGKAEYDHMRETLLRVKKVFTAEAAFIQVEADMKEQILHRFEQNRPKNISLVQQLATFFGNLIPSSTARFAMTLGMLLIVVTVSFVVLQGPQQEMAVLVPMETESKPVATDSLQSMGDMSKEIENEEVIESITASGKTEQGVVTMGASDDLSPAYLPVPSASSGAVLRDEVSKSEKTIVAEEKANAISMSESSPPVYRNSDGYMQYNNNSRMAEVPQPVTSDKYKDYSARKKSEEQTKLKKEQLGENATATKAELEDVVVAARKTASAEGKKEPNNRESIPVWAGFENNTNAYEMTLQKVKTFFEAVSFKSDDADQKQNKTVTLTLSFDEKGVVKKASVSGNIDDNEKKLIEAKALTLAAFKFTNPSMKPTLRSSYTFSL